jgi:site-specific recombinase XerD
MNEFGEQNGTALSAKADLMKLSERATDYARLSLSENTRRAYQADWQDFSVFCSRHGVDPLPATPQTIAKYVTAIAKVVKPTTIERRLAAIRRRHKDVQLPDPTKHDVVRTLLRGVFLAHGAQSVAKTAITSKHLLAMLSCLDRSIERCNRRKDLLERTRILVARDRAIVLLGFAGAFRRSELVSLDVEDLFPHPRGLRVLVRRSNTDQGRNGRYKAIPAIPDSRFDPVSAVHKYQQAACIKSGPLFRSFSIDGVLTDRRLGADGVARVVKRLIRSVGLDAADFSAHSLRNGFLTAAASKGASLADIAAVSHQSKSTVVRYWKEAQEFDESPFLKIFGLAYDANSRGLDLPDL